MYCPKCNGQIPDDSKFCPMCGATLLQAASQPQTSPPQYTQPQQPGYGAPPPGQPYGAPGYGQPGKIPPQFGNGMPYAVGAGVGIRFVATLVDFIILGVVNFIVSGVFGTQTTSYDASGLSYDFGVTGLPALLLFAFGVAYYLVMETLWGATVGKMVCGLKVVMQDGGKVQFVPVLLRYVLRIVDSLPFCIPYLVGAIIIWTSPYNQRLGDKVAKTLVVKSRAAKNFGTAGNAYFAGGTDNYNSYDNSGYDNSSFDSGSDSSND